MLTDCRGICRGAERSFLVSNEPCESPLPFFLLPSPSSFDGFPETLLK